MARPTRRATRLAACTLVLLLAVPVGVLTLLPGAALARASPTGAALVTDAAPVPSGSALTPLGPRATVHLEIALVPTDAEGLTRFTAEVIDPASPEYRHFLTSSEFDRAYAPSAAEVDTVSAYFDAHGATSVLVSPDRLGLSVTLSEAGAASALGVRYVAVDPPHGSPFVTALGTPRLPADIRGDVEGIDGLTDVGNWDADAEHLLDVRAQGPVGTAAPEIVRNTSSGQWWFTGTDYALGYRENALFPPTAGVPNATYATGEAIATILMSGYNQTNGTNLAPWDPAVINAYYNDTFPNLTALPYNWTHPTLDGSPITIDGVSPPLPGAYGVLQDDSGDEAENSLDLEMAGSFAPGALIDNFYFAASLSNLTSNETGGSPGVQDVADDFATCLAQALEASYGDRRLATVTNSYGLPDLNDTFWDSELVKAAAMGVTVVVASGDQGNAPETQTGYFQGQDPSWPGTAAFNSTGVVAVGGTSVNLTGPATGSYNGTVLNDSFEPNVTGLASQVAWYDTYGGPGNLTGSEGGVSPVVPEPYWQRHSYADPAIVNATVAQGGLTALGRAEPDLAFPANDTIAYVAAQNGTVYFELVEGTSIAAPIFAGMLAELSAVSGHLYGFLTPELYDIGSYYGENPGAGGDPLLPVTEGHNYLFQAGPGWNAVTGWGGLDPVAFLATDANATVAHYQYDGPSPGLPPKSPSGTGISEPIEILVLVVVVLAILFAVFALVRESRGRAPPSPYASVPPGRYVPTPGGPPPPFGAGPSPYGPPPATFLCPYCGSVRPAEPVRCPSCGAF